MKCFPVAPCGVVVAFLLALSCATFVGTAPAIADVVLPEPALSVTTHGTGWTALTQPDGKLLIAGTFTEVNGAQRLHVARFAGDAALDAGFKVDTDLPVSALAVAGNYLYPGGTFSTVGGKLRERWPLDYSL